MLRFTGLTGHSREWGLCVDGRLVASSDDPMTAELAQHWARRMLGEHVTFELGTWTVATGSRTATPRALRPPGVALGEG